MDIFDTKNIDPMLIENKNSNAFNSPDYIYELKFDGIRCLAYLSPIEGTELRNKRNKRVNSIYPELKDICKQVNKKCILDGELLILNNGKPDFFELQRRSLMSKSFKISLAAQKLPVCFTAFDILYYDNKEVTNLPLMKRKELLNSVIAESPRLAISRYIEEKGIELYNVAEANGLEGIVAKRKDSKYYFGKRSKDWVKCKALLDEDFVICGYYLKDKLSLILGAYQDDKLIYQSHVSMGLSNEDAAIVMAQKQVSKSSLYIDFPEIEEATWIRPELVCVVKFMERTPGGGLRQPVFKGIRDDKEPKECIV